MTGPTRNPDEETSEHTVVSPWLAPQQPFAPVPPTPAQWTPPPQQNWTPPPQQGWTPPPPPPQQWPSYQQGWSPAPSYGAPPYYPRADEYPSSPLVTISGVLLLVIGGIVTLIGVGVMFVGLIAGPFIESFDTAFPGSSGAEVASLIAVIGVVIGVIGTLQIAAAIGVFVHKSWARWLGLALAAVGLILGFFMLVGTMTDRGVDGATLVISVLWVAANGFVVAALAVASDHFQRRYQAR